MRKLELTPYSTGNVSQDGKPQVFEVKDSLGNILLDEKVPPREMLRRYELVKRIEASGDHILLEQEDWQRCTSALNTFQPSGRECVEFIRRILEAPEVEVQECTR